VLSAAEQPRDGTPATAVVLHGRNRALDGLRAVAVALVVAYHLDVPGVPGGFVGVDLFFVLSGYLITALLVSESDRAGAVSIRAFLRRRVRRLWPLAWLLLTLVAVAGLTGVWGADRQSLLPGETAASFANVANWWAIGHGGYVASFTAPSPLRHFWSLAVEEQFYLLWPVLLVGLLAASRRHRRFAAVPMAGVVALAAASVAVGFATTPAWAYLATPTRAVELLAGAALALAWRRWPLSGPDRPEARAAWGVAAVAGSLVVASVALAAHPGDRWLSRGGFALIGLAGAGIIAGALCGPVTLRRALASGPLVWIGVRSYAIYMLHWPIIVAFGPEADPATRAVVVLTTSVLGATVLHRFVERPVQLRRVRLRTLGIAGAALVVVSSLALVAADPSEPTPTEQAVETFDTIPDPPAPPSTPCAAPSSNSTVAPPSGAFDPGTISGVTDPPVDCGAVRVLVVGDSTGRGASNGLVRAADPRVSVWDRTVIGCSFNPECTTPWRETFQAAVDAADPQVVLVYGGVVSDLAGVEDAEFLSVDGRAQRVATLVEAERILSARGATVVFTTPATPRRPNGLFFCDGKTRNSNCDPAWVEEWNDSVRAAAATSHAGVIDVGSWIAAQPDAAATRPDGLHLSASALTDLGRWLAPQLVALAPPG